MNKSIAVLGMGRFGQFLTDELCKKGADVLIADADEETIRRFSDSVSSAIKADLCDPESIRAELASGTADGPAVIARHMDYGLYRVDGKADCPKDALHICRMLSMKPEILERIETAY